MNLSNFKINQGTYEAEFMLQVGKQIAELLDEIKQEYRETADQLAIEIIATYKQLKNLEPGAKQDNLLANLKHLEAGMIHFEATIEIKLYRRVMKICEIAMNIAIKVAIASLVAL